MIIDIGDSITGLDGLVENLISKGAVVSGRRSREELAEHQWGPLISHFNFEDFDLAAVEAELGIRCLGLAEQPKARRMKPGGRMLVNIQSAAGNRMINAEYIGKQNTARAPISSASTKELQTSVAAEEEMGFTLPANSFSAIATVINPGEDGHKKISSRQEPVSKIPMADAGGDLALLAAAAFNVSRIQASGTSVEDYYVGMCNRGRPAMAAAIKPLLAADPIPSGENDILHVRRLIAQHLAPAAAVPAAAVESLLKAVKPGEFAAAWKQRREQQLRQTWETDPEARSEFANNFDLFLAYTLNQRDELILRKEAEAANTEAFGSQCQAEHNRQRQANWESRMDSHGGQDDGLAAAEARFEKAVAEGRAKYYPR